MRARANASSWTVFLGSGSKFSNDISIFIEFSLSIRGKTSSKFPGFSRTAGPEPPAGNPPEDNFIFGQRMNLDCADTGCCRDYED